MLLLRRVSLVAVFALGAPSAWAQPMISDPGKLQIGVVSRLPRPEGFVVEDLRSAQMKTKSALRQTYKAPFSPFRQPVPLAKYERTIGDEELSASPVDLLAEKLIGRYGDALKDKRLAVHEFSYRAEEVVNKPQSLNYSSPPGGSLATALALSVLVSVAEITLVQGKGIDLRLHVKLDAELDGRRIEVRELPMTLRADDGPARVTRFAIEKFLHLYDTAVAEAQAAPAPAKAD
jgi:hypothetical protein